MIVSKLEIKGFRGVSSGELRLSKFTTLIGPNNCGKTTITEALALVLGRDRLVRSLTEHDFTGSNPAQTDRIGIIATITGFEPNDPAHHTDWFRWGRGTIKWFDIGTGAVKPETDKATDQLACQIGFAARFDHDTLEPVTARYFYDAAVDPFSEDAVIATVPAELIRKIGFFLVPASRTWDRTISFGSELFRRVVSYVGGKPAAAVLAERARLRAPQNPLESDEHLSELVGHINADIAALLGRPAQLKLRLTTTDSEGILESVVPHFGEGEAVPLPSRRHGSGLVSLQTLILLMRFGQLRVAAGDGFMMVIEEPELHVPPPLQRKLLRMMQTMATQIVVTTHSPTVAAIPDAHEIQMVANSAGTLRAKPLSKSPLAADAVNPIRSLLLSSRDATIYALMHSTVLVPEGRLDAAWLQQLVKALELSASDHADPGLGFAHEVGVVPTADSRAREVYEHLCDIHPSVFCLFDGDQQGNDYTAGVCHSNPPPRLVVRWPAGWMIEDVIGWIVDAQPAILAGADLVAMGVPQTSAALVTALRESMKTNEIVHGAIADAFVSNAPCRHRIGHLMKFLSDVAMGRVPAAAHGTPVNHANGVTTIWTSTMPFLAFEGPAGTGKTYRLIEEVRGRASELLGSGQRVLGLTFMHGSRRRLDESFASKIEIRGRGHAVTIDSFAAHVVKRWSPIAPAITDFTQFDQVCDACGTILERPEIAWWVSAAFPIVAIDEAQELKPCRLRIVQALCDSTHMVVAADEFQCLDDQLDTGPFVAWFATGDVKHLNLVRRTERQGLLNAGVALRAAQSPIDGVGLKIRYAFPAQVKFTVGHALRAGTGSRAVLVAPGSMPWANELIPQLAAGLHTQAQNIPPLPIAWDTGPADEAKKVAESLCGPAEQMQSGELVQRMKALPGPPGWVPMAISNVDMARRAHGVQSWVLPVLVALCERNANAHRAFGYSSQRGIRVMSIQAAKNRQFRDVVVLWGPGIPGSPDYHRRLLYNAISRAENSCTVMVRTNQLLQQPPFI